MRTCFRGPRCVSDGRWRTFFRDGKAVWDCNASYAAANFIIEPAPSEKTA
ncbi:hypothetical protein P3W85_18300 [Cupriavidus basilensis]|uniref:Uncharacterized protein n=1 Tax=Cupriavidus basilensis TaxID=68895 RepID=A0ABT6AR30_9BURK|nr:hypothetical protein [Cupriavidus basilensis]MDF3834894.1 hypothetical protein [Cupriavidus basilensis]